MDRRKLVALWERFLSAQGTHPRRRLARMVPHDEADRGRAALQVQGRNPRRMRHRRHLRDDAGLSLLLQGRAGLEHLPGAEERRREGCADVFRLLERMVTRSLAADRRGPADRGESDRKGGIKPAWFFVARPREMRPGGEILESAAGLPALQPDNYGVTKGRTRCPHSTILSTPTANYRDHLASAAGIAPRPSTSRRR